MAAVLIVDDDLDIRETLREVLAEEGYEVRTAAHGKEALEALKGGTRPCLILLDLMMPVMSGADFRRAQLEDPALKDIPTVAVSASVNLRLLTEELEALEFLAKPIELDELLALVERYCGPPRR